jgi:RNA polymerase sigma-70 factor (ECF subfamily)
MSERDLRALFERFRARGDAEALALAFDATAPELLRVARHLAHDRDEADDLVQATYLTALEKLASLERGREPLPWLIGILVLHAREARRRRGRGGELAIDLDELHARRGDAPDATSARRELSELVAHAVADLPESYRAVVAPYLDGSASSSEIAARVGRSPGVVRMQIHRALARLRRALPIGASLGLLGFDRELAALRARVLSRALDGRAGVEVALGVGGSIVGAKLLLSLAAVLLAALGVWWIADRSAAPARDAELAALPAATAGASREEAQSAQGSVADVEQRAAVAAAPAEDASVASAGAPEITGRLLEHDSTPLAGIEVALIELRSDWFTQQPFSAPVAAPEPVLSKARTDADGEFHLGCARHVGAVHVLGIDIGGSRGSARVIDAPLAPGVGADIGDFVMPSTGTLAGRAVDEHGEPLAGVVVLAAFVPVPVPVEIIADMPRCTALALVRKDEVDVLELPRWMRELQQRLPVSTVRTGGDGRFEIESTPGAPLIAFYAEGRPAVAIANAQAVEGKRIDVGEVHLPRGRSLKARVVEDDGTPVADARVVAGVHGILESYAGGDVPMFHLRPTATPGEYELDGLRDGGELVVAAQRASGGCWVSARTEAGEVELRLGAPARLDVQVFGHGGRALDEVEIELLSGPSSRQVRGLFARAAARTYRGPVPATFEGLVPGKYSLLVRAKELAPQWSSVDLAAPGTTVRLELAPVHAITVRVRDARTSSPVAGASVEVRTQMLSDTVDRATTDADGLARVSALTLDDSEDFVLRVEHPSYAPRFAVPIALDKQAIDVPLDLGGSLAIRVLERGQTPAKRYTLTLIGSQGRTAPLQIGLDARGQATVTRLSPGSRGYELREGVNGRDAFSDLVPERDDSALLDGGLIIVSGQKTELALELDKDFGASGDRARLRGRITQDGEPMKDVRFDLANLDTDANLRADVDAQGEFDFGWIAPGDCVVRARRTRAKSEHDLFLALFHDRVRLAPGEDRALEVKLHRRTIEVHITGPDGRPVADASAILVNDRGQPVSDATHVTGEEGVAILTSMQDVVHKLVCHHSELGFAAVDDVFAAASKEKQIHVTLDAGVPCEGWLELPPGFAPAGQAIYVSVHPDRGGTFVNFGREIDAAALPGRVRFVGLRPGRFRVSASSGRKHTRALAFELASGGDSNLTWRLEEDDN